MTPARPAGEGTQRTLLGRLSCGSTQALHEFLPPAEPHQSPGRHHGRRRPGFGSSCGAGTSTATARVGICHGGDGLGAAGGSTASSAAPSSSSTSSSSTSSYSASASAPAAGSSYSSSSSTGSGSRTGSGTTTGGAATGGTGGS